MPEKLTQQQEFSELFVKTLFPAFLIIAVSIAVDMKNNKNKISWFNALLSFVIGVSGAYLASDFIAENYQGGKFTIIVCTVSLLTEKVVKFIMNRLNIEIFLEAIVDCLLQKLKNILK